MKRNRRIGIPNLFPVELADGTIKYHWKPTPRMRRAGWANLDCGTDRAIAIQLAEARNAEIAAWDAGLADGIGHNGGPVMADLRPRTMRELADAYKKSHHFRIDLSPKTQRLYRHSIEKLMQWTDDGSIPVAGITREACLNLREHLVNIGQKSAAANTLRVLRLLLQYGVDRAVISVNPALKMKIPESDMRSHVIRPEAIELLDLAAQVMNWPSVRLIMMVGFWTMQREADLLSFQRKHWQILPKHHVPAQTRAQLADRNGDVWGFLNKTQQKTDEPIGAAVPPAVRDLIHRHIAENNARAVPSIVLFPDDRMGKAYSDKQFQRRFATIRMLAWYGAILRKDWRLAVNIRRCEFRDFRRTGMSFFAGLGIAIPDIAAISGHSIDYTQRIIAVYVPKNLRFAISGLAEAITRAAERTIIEERLEG